MTITIHVPSIDKPDLEYTAQLVVCSLDGGEDKTVIFMGDSTAADFAAQMAILNIQYMESYPESYHLMQQYMMFDGVEGGLHD